MKTFIRIILTFISFLASYYFTFWVPFSLIPDAHNIPAIPNIISFLVGLSVAILIWKKTKNMSNSLSQYVILGGIIVGSIGFILGFIGPIILSPNSNQGPLLGIFVTGPISFLVGLVGGGIYWVLKVKNRKILK
ncbi:hypothetical protein K8354_06280 [Polaribacter litorisediminis]|uniref:hypothetical protein n=1 Tax=Polaribacter litorisediminis TaxID=1908341 RepID=UPI001CBB8F04|nr:hypothetical protein [Polaribacter litorisediminis]UAM99414.1 hypothetical protein K8354_06280 [Polaribacter litorisediminis]